MSAVTVRAKAEGRQPEGMDAETAALFPDSFEESELGLVPKGLCFSNVEKLFLLTMGQSPPSETYNVQGDGLPFYQGRSDFGFRFPSKRIYCNRPTRFSLEGDILISVRAPVGDINVAMEKCCLGRGVAGILHKENLQSFALYSMQNLKSHFKPYNGEGTVFGAINKNNFQQLPVISPPSFIIQSFNKLVTVLDERIKINEEKILILSTLRDKLLPRLISGQLKISDARIFCDD